MTTGKRTHDPNNSSHLVLWRCIDTDGVDTCHYLQHANKWKLSGTAIFRLDYRVVCDTAWNSLSARVAGRVDRRQIDVDLVRTKSNCWELNGSAINGVDGLLEIDPGFTPATNAIKRLNLRTEEQAETKAVWFDICDWSFKPLLQAYHRHSELMYTYKSPSNHYQTDLQVDEFGIVRCYPDLWQAV